MKKLSPIQERIDFVFPLIKRYKNPKIIDLGCGTGLISKEIYEKLDINVTGLDLDKKSVEIAKKNCPQNTYLLKDISELKGFKADIVICSEVLEHLEDPLSLLKKIKPALSKNGISIITVPNGYGVWEIFQNQPLEAIRGFIKNKPKIKKIYYKIRNKLGLKAKDSVNEGQGSKHLQRFTLKKFKKLCKMAGLKIKEEKNISLFSRLIPFMILRNRVFYKIDQKLCEIVPMPLGSGWGFVLK